MLVDMQPHAIYYGFFCNSSTRRRSAREVPRAGRQCVADRRLHGRDARTRSLRPRRIANWRWPRHFARCEGGTAILALPPARVRPIAHRVSPSRPRSANTLPSGNVSCLQPSCLFAG